MLTLGQFLLEWKLYGRDRVALFWAFAFPVLLLLGLGTVFSPGAAPRYLGYLLPGLLGMNLVSMGLFNVGMVLVNHRETGKFRRLAVTPLPRWVFLLGQILHRVSLLFLQTALLLAVACLAYGIRNQGSYLGLAAVMALGAACFISAGFALSGLVRSIEGYSACANAAFFPLLFLSGVLFPLDTAPAWLRQAAALLPLSPCLGALRDIFGGRTGLAAHAAGLGLVALWTGACFLLAARRFRWA